ncbi:MAG TPA: sugar phosphate isomerase/epimerase family protein [Bryobacteraceae bacterium]|nr:sugar phosphate isomerase/epimerase family protein [Bryobacteraceae bacterium]HOQ46186.1 sugar phosphate isomerase/epimerase family protein [Bryobacteraceae bacterium]HPQ14364.1 sugar phosphate isomerase/epimerase family protein [Bryobacteraceae bacterium]HPU74419.1 sugar phosphate isomerase/epimerase family protein [Bryobacteraceae bacterium]
MQAVAEREVGLMFWAGGDPRETLCEVKSLGIRCGQLGVPGDMKLDEAAAAAWKEALAAEEFRLATVFAAYSGESYADIETVQKTVGFIPRATREERERRTYAVSDFAAALGVGSIACHIGFVPEDPANEDYQAVREMVRRVCDYAARHGQTFALETGQEPAHVLMRFLKDVDRPNLRVNFDPANMILYGTGDPIEALDVLGPVVISVHCKDGDWPAKPGLLGVEKPLGQGSVGIERFIAKLKEIGYRGQLNIERETEDRAARLEDIRSAVALLNKLR